MNSNGSATSEKARTPMRFRLDRDADVNPAASRGEKCSVAASVRHTSARTRLPIANPPTGHAAVNPTGTPRDTTCLVIEVIERRRRRRDDGDHALSRWRRCQPSRRRAATPAGILPASWIGSGTGSPCSVVRASTRRMSSSVDGGGGTRPARAEAPPPPARLGGTGGVVCVAVPTRLASTPTVRADVGQTARRHQCECRPAA